MRPQRKMTNPSAITQNSGQRNFKGTFRTSANSQCHKRKIFGERKHTGGPQTSTERATETAECLKARRKWQRTRRRKTVTPPQKLQEIYQSYKKSADELRCLVKIAKIDAWQDLTNIVSRDPWDRPYRTILGKIKQIHYRILG